MILVHLSRISVNQIEKTKYQTFSPRIPKIILSGEDKTIPRLCLSSNVDGCLSALPKMHLLGGNSTYKNQYTGIFFAVYYFDIPDSSPHLLKPKDIKKKVSDAIENQEYWYLKPIKPFDIKYICVKNISQLDYIFL